MNYPCPACYEMFHIRFCNIELNAVKTLLKSLEDLAILFEGLSSV